MKLRGGEIVTGSCLDPERGMPALEDKSVDHVITDPPYEAHVHDDSRRVLGPGGVGAVHVSMDFDAITEPARAEAAEHMVRISRGWVLVFSALEGIGPWQAALLAAGAKKRNTCIWVKTHCTPKIQGDGPASAAEAIVCAWAGKGRSVWNAHGSYGTYSYPVSRGPNRRHSCEKPLALMEQLILDFTMPGQLILDPFLGGGTTAIAAKILDREWAGYEQSARDVAIAAEAIENADRQTYLQQLMRHKQRRESAYAGRPIVPLSEQLSLEDTFAAEKEAAEREERERTQLRLPVLLLDDDCCDASE
jgi:hypothetical protein